MSQSEGLKQWGIWSGFNPEEGMTIVEPPGNSQGFWSGGCSAIYDAHHQKFFLFYRSRKPITEGRGGTCHILESTDGFEFKEIWKADKAEFDNSESIEGASLIKTPEGLYRLYISYINTTNRKWDLAMLEADHPSNFDPSRKKLIYGSDELDSEGIKDPYIALIGGIYYLFIHYAPKELLPPNATHNDLHGTGNIFATDLGIGTSGLAISSNGTEFTFQGEVIPPGNGWDKKLTRVDTIIYTPPCFTVLYSGRSDISETYEDRTGIAITMDMRNFYKLSEDSPALSSPHSTGALRYADAVTVDDRLFIYYEYARPDASHELRVNIVPIT